MSVGRSVCRSILSRFAFFAFLSCLRVKKFRFDYFTDINAPAQITAAPAQIIAAPAQIIIAPAQLIIVPAQPPAAGVTVYTALFLDVGPAFQ